MVFGTESSKSQAGRRGLKGLLIVISEAIQTQDPWIMQVGPALTLTTMSVCILVSGIAL